MILQRDVHPDVLAALAGPVVYPAVLVVLDWPGGLLRFHTGRGVLSWGGYDWAGTGQFDDLSIGEEGEGLAAADASLRLLGPVDACLQDSEAVVKNRLAEIYTALTTMPGGTVLIGAPFLQFSGAMDGLVYQQSGGRHGLQLSLTAGPGARVGAAISHSAEDQDTRFPGDTAGRHTQLAAANARVRTWPE